MTRHRDPINDARDIEFELKLMFQLKSIKLAATD